MSQHTTFNSNLPTNTNSNLPEDESAIPTCDGSNVFRLRDMVKPSFDLWLISWLLGLVTAISMVALLMISGWFITGAALAGMIAVGSHAFNYMLPAGIIRMLAMARTAGRYGELMVSHNAVFNLLKKLRLRFFNRLAALPMIQQRHTLQASQYMHRLVSDIDKLDEFVLRVVSPWLIATLTVILLSGFMYWSLPINTSYQWLIYTLLGISLLLPLMASIKGIAHAQTLSQIAEARRQKLLAPIAIVTQLILWRQWHAQTKEYIAKDNKFQRLQWQAQVRRSIYTAIIQWLIYAIILMVLFAIFKTMDSVQLTSSATAQKQAATEINIPIILAVTLGLFGIQEVIVPLGQHYLAIGNSIAAKNRLNNLLASSRLNHTTDSDTQLSVIKTLPTDALTAQLDNVCAKMPNALVGAKNVNVQVTSGLPLIIKGASGCGKSTLLQALAGEIPITSGKVTLNAHDWFTYDWQDQLGYLGQQLDIFDQSLAKNLRLGKRNASDEELVRVLEKVGLKQWLKAQPQGLDTQLGEYGTAISGGQARRIALARLLLKPRQVLLLDEPFAGLDAKTRELLWQQLKTHQQHGLLIVVSHHEWDMGDNNTLTLQADVF